MNEKHQSQIDATATRLLRHDLTAEEWFWCSECETHTEHMRLPRFGGEPPTYNCSVCGKTEYPVGR